MAKNPKYHFESQRNFRGYFSYEKHCQGSTEKDVLSLQKHALIIKNSTYIVILWRLQFCIGDALKSLPLDSEYMGSFSFLKTSNMFIAVSEGTTAKRA